MKATNVANNGGPAFPTDDYYFDGGKFQGGTGMTLRDYFAGQALAAIQAPGQKAPEFARLAYKLADAMLAEREKEAQ
jgi:hypothetical protein